MADTEDADRRLIEQQIAELKKRLRAAQSAQASAENDKFQVVPFDPHTGTTRRPILIECTAAGIRFIPENVAITAADLEGFTPRTNPLAAGTGALINYWTEWNAKQKNPKAEPEPYPLLLVRPEGTVAYYVAMKMLEPIHANHGYELIESSTSLQLPEVDPGAKAALETAVRRLLLEREHVYRSAVAGGTGGSAFGRGTSRGRGGGPAVGRGQPGRLAGSKEGSNSDADGDAQRVKRRNLHIE